MKKLTNYNGLKELIHNNKKNNKSMENVDLKKIPQISKPELLELAKVLAYDDTIAVLRENHKLVWHVAMPKSGSTWVTTILQKGLIQRDWSIANLIPESGRREQEISPIELSRQGMLDRDVFAVQQHCVHSGYVQSVISKFDIKVILQIRSIPDCIMSSIDHLNSEGVYGPLTLMTKKQWDLFPDTQKLSYVIDFIVPWYIRFWVSWATAIATQNITITIVNYDDLLQNPNEEFFQLAKFCDNNIKKEEIHNWLNLNESTLTRKNKAVTGRGHQLPNWVHKKLKSLIRHYPEIDFEPVGIYR